jgi:ATP-dependent DNA helicase 2 subunit 2
LHIDLPQVKEAKAKSFKNVYARDPDAGLEKNKTYHLNNEAETEIEREDTVDGKHLFSMHFGQCYRPWL